MTEEIYRATKEHCGALAVSWYEPFDEAKEVIKNGAKYQIKTNVHFLLNKQTLPLAIDLITNNEELLKQINAIIFLNYKPVHSTADLCIGNSEAVKNFLELIAKVKLCKIGFDSCMISYLSLIGDNVVPESVEFCEAGRFSAFVSEDMLFYPCSFLKDISNNGVDLRTRTLQDGWKNGEEFIKMRHSLSTPSAQNYSIVACNTCNSYQMCHGGCQIFNINRCGFEECA
jgi:radical SAM protein with 4Fe4S-binding SPASM domain